MSLRSPSYLVLVVTLFPSLMALPQAAEFFDLPVLLGTWFGSGLVDPLRAGLAVATVWLVASLGARRSPALVALAACFTCVAGVWAATAWELQFTVADDRRIVIDEVAGYLAGMAVIGRVGWMGGAGFAALFLALDRLKPWPLEAIESLSGGIGVIADDVFLGLALGLILKMMIRVRNRRLSS